jgi:cytochrome c-type biogenesis protein CcmF
MSELGSLTLLIGLALAVFAMMGSILGSVCKIAPLEKSAKNATYILPIILAVSTLNLILAFVVGDFSIAYVAEHSNLVMDRPYIWVALYAGNAGSLLFIALVHSIFSALAIALAPASLKSSLPYTGAILMAIQVFFLAVMVILANPFEQLAFTPLDGQGINPLLTHPGMFIHPPLLMTGLICVSIPFAFAMGTMISGASNDDWLDTGRQWGLVVWAILGSGLLLGAWWAYTILGWGGYWAWDPIENAGLMPFLVLTAFVHSIMVQKRLRMFRLWNIILINVAFSMALFGIFINRGGPIPSIHSFGASTLGWVFLGFLGLSLVFSFSVFFFRYSNLRSISKLDSMLSREAAFLVNNLLFLGVAFVTLWGVVFPLISQLFNNSTVTVGTPFYNQVNGPLLLALIFLMGIGPLLPWRHASWKTIQRAVLLPAIFAGLVLSLLIVLGIHKPVVVVSIGFCSVVVGGIFQEWGKGVYVRHSKGENYFVSFIRLIAANRPRYGGYIAHLAVVVLSLGIVGSSFYDIQEDIVFAEGDTNLIGNYNVKYVGARIETRSDRTEFFNTFEVTSTSGRTSELTAWRAYYPEFRMTSSRAAIRSTPVEDLYIVTSETLEDGRVVARVRVNPLVWWMWWAGPLLILGAVVALWPERLPSIARIPIPKHSDNAHQKLSS